MATKIKICGVRTDEAVDAALAGGATHIGLMFVPESPRVVTADRGRQIVRRIAGRAKVVGVFRDESAEEIRRLAKETPLDMVQLHGRSRQSLPELAGVSVVLSMAFDGDAERGFATANELAQRHAHLSGLLLDTPDPTKLGGGTGVAFDWNALGDVLRRVTPAVPLWLAGGLRAENVAKAIKVVRPHGVDVSSGVEIERGKKDPEKIQAFCDAVHGADGSDQARGNLY